MSSRSDRSPGFDLYVFDQARWWRTPDGRVLDLDDCNEEQRRELRAWLVSHARFFYLAVLRRELVAWVAAGHLDRAASGSEQEALGPSVWGIAAGGDDGPANRQALSGPQHPVPTMVYVGAEEWLVGTALVRRLSE